MREVLRPVRTGYHWLRDRAHYAPRPWFRPGRVVRGGRDSAAILEELRREGICVLERYLDTDRAAEARRAAGAVLDAIAPDERGMSNAYHLDLAANPLLAELVLDEVVLAAFEGYYGRPLFLADRKLQRLEPTAPYEDRSFQWHHDTKGTYVKAMWLLTDVPPDGQRMSFIAGSHRQWRPPSGYAETRFGDSEARQMGRLVECAGPAGTLILFDTNGIHRGNRNAGPRRDVLFGVYTAGRYLRGRTPGPDALPWLSPRQRAVLDRTRRASPA